MSIIQRGTYGLSPASESLSKEQKEIAEQLANRASNLIDKEAIMKLFYEGKNMSPSGFKTIKNLSDGISASVSLSDLNPHCSNCRSTNTKLVGVVTVGEKTQDAYHCSACSRLFTKIQGGVRQFVETIAEETGVSMSQVSFTSIEAAVQTTNKTFPVPDLSYNNNATLENEARNQTSELRELKSTMTNILHELRRVVEQNHQLQEKMASDPLLGLRDKINKFEIK